MLELQGSGDTTPMMEDQMEKEMGTRMQTRGYRGVICLSFSARPSHKAEFYLTVLSL